MPFHSDNSYMFIQIGKPRITKGKGNLCTRFDQVNKTKINVVFPFLKKATPA